MAGIAKACHLPQGHLLSTTGDQHGRSRLLDRRAVAIVHAAAPFGAFSAGMRKQADQIVVTSRFRFTREEGLETTLTTTQH